MNKEDAAYWNSHGEKIKADPVNAYLYSLWTGQFIVKKTTIEFTDDGYNRGEFKAFSINNTGKVHQVAVKEGELYNGMVWFCKRNDDVASLLLIEQAEQNIWKLKETIEKYEYKVSLIKRGVIEK